MKLNESIRDLCGDRGKDAVDRIDLAFRAHTRGTASSPTFHGGSTYHRSYTQRFGTQLLTDGPPGCHNRYAITVYRDTTGRGGSVDLIDQTKRGDRLVISPPRNTFQLAPSRAYLFIAGGIGITAIRSMALEVARTTDASGLLIYLTKSRANSAYLDDMLKLSPGMEVLLHHSTSAGRLDLWPYLSQPDETHLYCCGPTPLMDEVRALTMHWRPSRVHFENFQESMPWAWHAHRFQYAGSQPIKLSTCRPRRRYWTLCGRPGSLLHHHVKAAHAARVSCVLSPAESTTATPTLRMPNATATSCHAFLEPTVKRLW